MLKMMMPQVNPDKPNSLLGTGLVQVVGIQVPRPASPALSFLEVKICMYFTTCSQMLTSSTSRITMYTHSNQMMCTHPIFLKKIT